MHPRADERFDFERLLGEGPAARVWLVRDRVNGGSRLALKEFREDGLAVRLDRELHAQSLLAHPGLAGIYGSIPGGEPRMPRVAREFVDGVRLADHLRGRGGEGARDLPAIAAEALRVLDWLAAFDRPHGNLTPGNLLLRKHSRAAYRVAVLDGGVLSAPGPGPASFAYLAPERLGGDPPTIAGDVYALGIVLFEALHGRTPYRVRKGGAEAWIATISAGRRIRPAIPAPLPDAADGWLEALIHPEPASRPTPREALRELAGFAGAQLEQETATGTAARLARAGAVVREDAMRALWGRLSLSREPRLVWVCGAAADDRDRLLRCVATEAAGRGWQVTLASRVPARMAAEIASCAGDVARAERQCRPGLLMLPCLDRADGNAIVALERILLGGGKPALRVVAGLDPDGIAEPRLRQLVERAGRGPSLRRVDLGPLSEAETAALARRCGSTLDATALDALRMRTTGDADRIGAALMAGREGGELDAAALRLRAELSADTREWLASDRAAAGDDAAEAVAAGLAFRFGDRPLRSRGRLLRQLSALEAEAGEPDAAVEPRGPAASPPPERSSIDAGLEALAGEPHNSAPDEAAHRLQRELARAKGDVDAEIRARTALATVFVIAGRHGEAITRARQAAEIAARWGDLDAVAEARAVRAIALGRCGRITDAGMLLEAGAADEHLGLGAAADEATRLATIETCTTGGRYPPGSRVRELRQRDDRPDSREPSEPRDPT